MWIGMWGLGLDRYDPVNNTFTHFRHNPKDAGSLSNDIVTDILQDKAGNLWVGTYGGLDLLNPKTGKFTHYANRPNDTTSLSYNHIKVLYEDKQGTLWVGCGNPTDGEEKPEDGGLNRLDKRTGKFTRYLHDSLNPNSIANNKVRGLLEDRKGNFWVGTAGDGLHTLNRATGVFTHYYYDSTHPEKLSRPPVAYGANFIDNITFLQEDANGFIWIGSFYNGINQYNPDTKKIIHHGNIFKQNKYLPADTLPGFKDLLPWQPYSSKDGLLWICTLDGGIYTVNTTPKPVIPYVVLNAPGANTFYEDKNGSLWISTDNGLIRKDTTTGKEKKFLHEPGNKQSLSDNHVNAMLADGDGKLWLGTYGGGLDKFDPLSETFTHYTHDDTKKGSLSSNLSPNLYFDHDNNLWIATEDSGLNKLDMKTGFITSYKHDNRDSNSISNNEVYCMVDDENMDLWTGTFAGLNRLNKKSGKFQHYLPDNRINSVCVDNENVLWAGGVKGLYRYDRKDDRLLLYEGNGGLVNIKSVLDIIEDDKKNLWVSTTNAIYKIGADRNTVRIYGNENGVHTNIWEIAFTYKTKSGKLLLGDQGGYYAFFPEQIVVSSYPLQVNITSFQIGDVALKPGESSALKEPLYKAKEVSLLHNQNSFSIGFWAINYINTGEVKYRYMLENYDNVWHDAGAEHKAYFFNIPPGSYIFHVRAMNTDGEWSEQNTLHYYSTSLVANCMGYSSFCISFIAIVWGFFITDPKV